jgi:hypothetical protein
MDPDRPLILTTFDIVGPHGPLGIVLFEPFVGGIARTEELYPFGISDLAPLSV